MEPASATPRQNPLPNELINPGTLYTLAGSTAAVWVVCLVISGIAPANFLDGAPMRVIAFALSLTIMLMMLFSKVKKPERTPEQWMLCLLNACLIWLNTSGMTSVSKNLFVSAPPLTGQGTIGQNPAKQAGFSMADLFRKQAAWWPDPAQQERVRVLLAANEVLSDQLQKTVSNTAMLSNTLAAKEKTEHLLRDSLIHTWSELAMVRSTVSMGRNRLMTDLVAYRDSSANLGVVNSALADSLESLKGTYATVVVELDMAQAHVRDLTAEVAKQKTVAFGNMARMRELEGIEKIYMERIKRE